MSGERASDSDAEEESDMFEDLTRRDMFKSVAASAALAMLPAWLRGAEAPAARKPNIIYILADDLGYGDVGCYGQEKIRTPRIDQMAAEGMRFTQHYAGSTVCAPSRSCLLTGQHTGHTRVRGNSLVPLEPSDKTIGEMLQASGYRTGCIGKWGLGEPETTGIPNKKGFDHFFGYLNQREAHYHYPPHLWRNEQKVVLEGNDREKRIGAYSHDLMTDEALQFVRENKERPFFLYLAYTIPHLQLAVPEDSLAEYKGKWPETPAEGGHYGRCEFPRATRAAMITRMDRDIGRVFDLLKELGLDENTVVMFASDNGAEHKAGADTEFFNSAGPLRGNKRDLYEGAIRIPMIARWPGRIRPATVSDHVCAFWDVMPTLAEISGSSMPTGVDGISFAPTLLHSPGQRQHEYLYWEFYEVGGLQAVRLGNWKGVRLDCEKNPGGPIALCDLSSDLKETRNLAEAQPQIVKRMAEIMAEAHAPSPIKRWNFGSAAGK
jgi:arylsulfatase A-like enzyme